MSFLLNESVFSKLFFSADSQFRLLELLESVWRVQPQLWGRRDHEKPALYHQQVGLHTHLPTHM